MADDGDKTVTLAEHQAQLAETRRKYESKADDAASKALQGFLGSLGYESADGLKEALEAAKTQSEAGKTDLEKAQRDLKKATADLEKERLAHTGTRNEWHGTTVEAALLKAASDEHACDPEDFFFRLKAQVEVGADGKPIGKDGTSVADLVKNLTSCSRLGAPVADRRDPQATEAHSSPT